MGCCLAKFPEQYPEALSRRPPAASLSTSETSELQECIGLLKAINDTDDIDELIHMIHQLLQREKSKQLYNPENASTSSQVIHEREEESSSWTSMTNSGSKFLIWLNKCESSETLHQEIKVAAETLQKVGQIQSIVGGLSTVAYVLIKFEKMPEIRPEILEVLGDMIDLARHLRSLKDIIPDEKEKFMKAIELIVEGSITCLCQLESNRLFRFIKSSVNSENLSNFRRRINDLYPNLLMTTMLDMRKDIPSYLPITKPIYPQGAVGIENAVNEIMDLLETTDKSSVAVVIYGFGGIGKTTVAEAVVSKINLNNYNYTIVEIYQEQAKKDLMRSQQQILKDCFPDYNGGKLIEVRSCKDGRGQLMEAFKCRKNKAIFLFIDNASRSADLKELLPQDLGGLPQSSRILVTTRRLAATDMFQQPPNLVRKPYHLKTLPDKKALEILFKNPTESKTIKDDDLERILKICSGVPLVLRIVGAHLHKQRDQVQSCSRLLEALEKGGTIKEENLTECLVDFVYGELEDDSQEAFIDICCFFSNWNRQDVEYIVGAREVTSLLEAGLITSTPEHNDPNAVFPHWEELIVHNIIKAKGRSLASGTRIMDVRSLSKAADEQRLNKIKGVWLVDDKSKYVIEERDLNLMRESLTVLALGDSMTLGGEMQMKFEELRYLRIGGDTRQIPVKLEALDRLKVYHGPFFVGGEISLYKLPKNLLAMKALQQSVVPEYKSSQMTLNSPECLHLEKLDFSKLFELPKIPAEFNKFVALKTLNLNCFLHMWELPHQITQLPNLSVLTMTSCVSLEYLPDSFGQLTTLTYLDLYGCRELRTLPDTFGQLKALRYLDLSKCDKLQALPSSFRQLPSLQHLECSEALKKSEEIQRSQVIINSGFFHKLGKEQPEEFVLEMTAKEKRNQI